jgi:hypothetical protein
MHPTDHELLDARTPLVNCPVCNERLERADELVAALNDVVLDRVCPSCDYRDSVVAGSLDVAMWQRGDAPGLADLRPLVALLVEQEIA